jgi:hypothetical protein
MRPDLTGLAVNGRPMLTIADCEICRELGEHQSSFTKAGRPEDDYAMSGPVDRLEALPPPAINIQRCPICGTCYQYEYTYEYYVNGSEDSEDLTRLTPVEARPYLPAEFYDEITAQLPHWLQHPELTVRCYAAQSLMALYQSENNAAAMLTLLHHPEPDLILAVMRYLVSQTKKLPFPELVDVLKQFQTSPDPRLTYLTGVVLRYIVPK